MLGTRDGVTRNMEEQGESTRQGVWKEKEEELKVKK